MACFNFFTLISRLDSPLSDELTVSPSTVGDWSAIHLFDHTFSIFIYSRVRRLDFILVWESLPLVTWSDSSLLAWSNSLFFHSLIDARLASVSTLISRLDLHFDESTGSLFISLVDISDAFDT